MMVYLLRWPFRWLACTVPAWALFLAFECQGSEIRELQGGDYWHYKGEVEASSAAGCTYSTMCRAYCNDGYCAHGSGRLGTDGSWWYTGTFVHGRMEGSGTYENDFYEYVGGFRNGRFHGHGVLDCFSGRRFEGEFVDGKMMGPFKVSPHFKTQMYSGEIVGWAWPCEGNHPFE